MGARRTKRGAGGDGLADLAAEPATAVPQPGSALREEHTCCLRRAGALAGRTA